MIIIHYIYQSLKLSLITIYEFRITNTSYWIFSCVNSMHAYVCLSVYVWGCKRTIRELFRGIGRNGKVTGIREEHEDVSE